jgi:hypothetical protein
VTILTLGVAVQSRLSLAVNAKNASVIILSVLDLCQSLVHGYFLKRQLVV